MAILACSAQRRPENIPDEAVQVAFGKGGGWVHCWLDTAIMLNRCRMYNSEGDYIPRFGHETDKDDVFLRYQGFGPVLEPDLQIDIGQTQPDFVWLKNGVILLPRNDYDNQKNFVDQLKGLRTTR